MNRNVAQDTLISTEEKELDVFNIEKHFYDKTSEDLPYCKFEEETQEKSFLSAPSHKVDRFSPFEIKQINREITKKIPLERKIELMNFHSFLVKKKFKEGLSKDEKRKLEYIRWQLDRIHDVEQGEELDRLEMFVSGIESFANDINKIINNFDVSKKYKRPKK